MLARMAKTGRPSKFTPELFARICERLSRGETLTAICRDDGMPAVRTVNEWTETSAELSASFARARAEGFDSIADEAITIADATDPEMVNCARLQVDTRKWLLARWDPKRYGDRMQIDADVTVEKLSDADLDAKLAKLQAAVFGAIGGKGEAAE